MERRLSTTSDSSTDSRNSSADSDGAQGRVPKSMAPKVAVNPLQFVKVGPCGLYRSAQEQLKKVEEIKKSKKVCKDEGEDWQSNLDNWKCSRRKIQEHIIERVVEVKKFELAEHERNRRKSKTFNEMMQERITKGRKTSLPVYYDDDAANDLSDLGLSSSKTNDNINEDTENEKESGSEKTNGENDIENPEEMTYEWAIQSYVNFAENRVKSKSTTAINEDKKKFHPPVAVKPSEKVEGYLKNLENNNKVETKPLTVPKVNINSKREMFEKMKDTSPRTSPDKVKNEIKVLNLPSEPLVKNRLMNIESLNKSEVKTSIKERLIKEPIQTVSLKERMNSLQQSVNKEIPKQEIITNSADEQTTHERSQSPDEMKRHYRHRSLDSLDIDENISGSFERVQSLEDLDYRNYPPSTFSGDTDREDSGIHTADVSSSVSQADDYDLHLDHLDDIKANHQPPIEEETKFDEKFDFDKIENITSNLDQDSISNQKISELVNIEQDQTKNEVLLNTTEIPCEQIQHVNTSAIVMEAIVKYDNPPDIKELHKSQNITDNEQFKGIIMDVFSDTQQECLFNLNPISMEPPKEKPPPPPIDISDDDDEKPTKIPLRRLDSTKRIKKEIRQKRSSFLGIEGSNDDSYLEPELDLVRPPDMTALLTEERRLERQLYRQSVCSESDSNQESRDSGVELDNKIIDTWSHSRNDSEIYGTQSTNSEEDEIMKKEREIIEALEQEEKIRKQDLGEKLAMRLRELEAEKHRFDWTQTQENSRDYCNYKDEVHEEIREKTRPDTIYLPETVQTVQWSQRVQEEPNMRRQNHSDIQYRKSMQDLTHIIPNHIVPIPFDNLAHRRSMPNLQEVVQRRPPPPPPPEKNTNIQNMTKQKLQAISAAPRSKLISNDTWQAKRKQQKPEYNYQHWLIQEAEHRRITEQQQRTNHPCNKKWPNGHYYPDNRQNRPIPNKKPLPDSIIQTLTQRVQRMNSDNNNNNRRRIEMHHTEPHYPVKDTKDKMLSVSGKKRCSHCGEELGRGAAMIIESLQLFYHIDCFKCCVCCLQLGDGLMGTDVRVRNNKLHCHNCYSSDDGAKFSCV